MGFFEKLLHPTDFLGLTDLRMGTMILSGINFVLIAVHFGENSGTTWRVIYSLIVSIISLICTGLGCWGAYKNNMQHVSWYFFYTFVNLIFSIINLIVAFPSIYGIIISIVHLLIAIYTVTVVKGFLNQLNGSSGAAGVV